MSATFTVWFMKYDRNHDGQHRLRIRNRNFVEEPRRYISATLFTQFWNCIMKPLSIWLKRLPSFFLSRKITKALSRTSASLHWCDRLRYYLQIHRQFDFTSPVELKKKEMTRFELPFKMLDNYKVLHELSNVLKKRELIEKWVERYLDKRC